VFLLQTTDDQAEYAELQPKKNRAPRAAERGGSKPPKKPEDSSDASATYAVIDHRRRNDAT